MKRLPIPVFLLSLLLIATACSMPYIADIPEWMAGDWDIFSESGEYIGRCEIDTWSINIYPKDSSEGINLIDNVLQNGGWTETKDDIYIIYADALMDTSYSFLKRNEKLTVEIWTTSATYTFTLKNRS